MQVVSNTNRRLRSDLSVRVQVGSLPLFALSPKFTGQPTWRFATVFGGEYHLIGKGVASRDLARTEGRLRYGQAIKENRTAVAAKKLAA